MRFFIYSFDQLHRERPLRPLTGLTLHSSVIELKHAIAEQLGVPYWEQRVMFAGKVLYDQMRVSDCFGLRNGSTFHLLERIKPPEDAAEPPAIPPPMDAKANQEADDLKLARMLAMQWEPDSDSEDSE